MVERFFKTNKTELLEKTTTKGDFMKYVLLFIMVWIMGGCATTTPETTIAPQLPPASAFPVPNAPSDLVLAWSGQPDGAKWTAYLDEAMSVLPENGPIVTPCKKLTLKPCAKQLLSIMAKRESGFKPETSFKEDFNDSKGSAVISRGLFQISQESANQKAYGCGIKKAQDLHDPKINIECAVKILAYQAKKTGTLIDGQKGGCGAYWSVCRSKNGASSSYKEISTYMSKY